MRGKGNFHVVTHTKVGITPAYAGKRIAELQTPAVSWDHPRVCGEKVPITCVPKYALGSPPRVRGKVCWRERHRPVPGITPACAGKSGRTSGLTRPARDHPRACGEKSTSTSMMNCGWGSPPRVRGKDGNQSTGQHRGRITPAYAGKSGFGSSSSAECWDHPRVCGEKTVFRTNGPTTEGSPPRMRGKGGILAGRVRPQGITPAYAGKRSPKSKKDTGTRDHPRVCGEKLGIFTRSDALPGSPPRMRGKDALSG